MVRAIVVVCVTPPPVAVTVMVAVPVVSVLLAVKVRVELPLPGAAMEAGLKLAVTPAGRPDADKETAELKPPLTVVEIVLLPEVPCVTDKLAGDAPIVKSGVAAATMVRAIVAVSVMPPPVAVMVTFAVPVVAVALAVNVRVELPLPGAAMDAGLKAAVTPDGKPETVSETAELNPPLTVVEMVLLPEVPCVTDRLVGDALSVKSGVAAALMVRAMVVVWVTPPPVAVMVTFAVPVVAVAPAVNVRVELPLPGAAMDAGLKAAVTPDGKPETVSETAELNPPLTVVEMVLLPVLP